MFWFVFAMNSLKTPSRGDCLGSNILVSMFCMIYFSDLHIFMCLGVYFCLNQIEWIVLDI